MAILSLDVQLLAIEWVYRASQYTSTIDYDTLRACALVCRAWTATAQRLLFRRISREPFYSLDRRLPLLVHTLRTSPHLSAHVRSIRLGPILYSVRLGPYEFQNDHIAAETAIAMLELCPHVEGITFTALRSGPKWSTDLEPRLRALPLHPTFLAVDGQPKLVSRVVQMWPTIRVLVVSAQCRAVNPVLRPRVLPTAVQALTLNSHFTAYLLSPEDALPTVHDLTLSHPVRWSDARYSQHIRSVVMLSQIRTLQLRGAFPPQDIIDELGKLEGLIIDDPPAHPVSLPKSLRHFGYHSDSDRRADTEFVTTALRGLSSLQCVSVTRQGHPDMCTALEEMCRSCGVDFVTYESAESFMQPRHIDWI
ncbi:hypothetical protein FA95DRAFT_982121 [Auriscalpium vulgare]|uniref:Uncharacterized protein n=1 Tax=Auriscalpium vulgare TaxID=40419 RepID=A0ACB8R6P3_9AGAM|nr:hypothetical protein FA95DRAFT_982121 [Auriscalpium vulgare]